MATFSRRRISACRAVSLCAVLTGFALVGTAWGEAPTSRDDRLLAPLPSEPPPVPDTRFKSDNPIDHFLAKRWEEAGIRPAPRSDDATFCRRIYLDIAGVIPSGAQLERFQRQPKYLRREKLIDKLLAGNRYAAHWGIFWEDLLRARTREPGAEPDSFRNYIQDALTRNVPYDQWVRDMVTADGTMRQDPAANFVLRHRADANELTITVTQVFMGMQLQCVQCHDDRTGRFWKNDDFKGMADFWSGTRLRPGVTETISTPKGPQEIRILRVVGGGDSDGTFLGSPTVNTGHDREALAKLLTDRSNPYFARAIVNRIWKRMMGEGLVEPVDDLDPSNPPSHPELLDWLALDFIEHGYDLQHVIRRIATSRAYQLDSVRLQKAADEPDRRLFDSMPLRRMTAEQLYDSILVCCGVLAENDARLQPAIQTRYPSPPNSFLATFGAHARQSIEEHDPEATIPQALSLLNGNFINRAVSWHKNNPLRLWAEEGVSLNKALDRLYMHTLSRRPTQAERRAIVEFMGRKQTPAKWCDLQWALINTREFMFIR